MSFFVIISLLCKLVRAKLISLLVNNKSPIKKHNSSSYLLYAAIPLWHITFASSQAKTDFQIALYYLFY